MRWRRDNEHDGTGMRRWRESQRQMVVEEEQIGQREMVSRGGEATGKQNQGPKEDVGGQDMEEKSYRLQPRERERMKEKVE